MSKFKQKSLLLQNQLTKKCSVSAPMCSGKCGEVVVAAAAVVPLQLPHDVCDAVRKPAYAVSYSGMPKFQPDLVSGRGEGIKVRKRVSGYRGTLFTDACKQVPMKYLGLSSDSVDTGSHFSSC